MKKNHFKSGLTKVLYTIALPVIVYVLFQVICRICGITTFGVGTDLQSILFTTVYTGFISLAMAINLNQGRIDYSIGSTMILAGIIGGHIASDLKASSWLALLIMLATGAIIGIISGIIYILLRIDAMITGIGLAMVYEGIGNMIYGGQGIRFSLKETNTMFTWGKLPWCILIIALVVFIMVALSKYTKFGYNSWALTGNRKIATERGINGKSNAVICYAIAGALLGIAIFVHSSKYGYVGPEAGLSTGTYMITGFLPFAVGELLYKYCDLYIGVIVGTFCQAMLTSFMVQINLSVSMQTVINGIVICGLLIYTSNQAAFIERKAIKQKLLKLKNKLAANT